MMILAVLSVVGAVALVIALVWAWRDYDRLHAEAVAALAAERASITIEEREAAMEMLMDTLSRWPYPLTEDQKHHVQSKRYAVAAMQWKKMGEQLKAMRRSHD